MYTDKLDDIINECNNAYHRKIKPIDVKTTTYINFEVVSNDKGPKFKVVDCVRISKYKNILVKDFTRNWLEKVLVIKKVKNTVPQTYVIEDLNRGGIVGTFYEKNCKMLFKQSLDLEKQ